MFGSHLSIAGSMVNALREAEALGMDTVQVFTKNQQQWRARPLDPGVVRDWNAQVARLGWHGRTVSHASYLINLASPDADLWRKSVDLMVDEVQRCVALGIPYLVHHPGAHTTGTREEGLRKIAQAYGEIFARTPGASVVSCLENTVGSGSHLGRTFEELADLRRRIVDQTALPERIGYCIDTCHLHAGGYCLATRGQAANVLAELDRVCGLGNVKVLHVNDSRAAAGSRRDLHAHIGEGTIGCGGLASCGFAAVMNHAAFRGIPKILETPKGVGADGTPHDSLNLDRLKRLIRGAKRSIKSDRSEKRVRTKARRGAKSKT